MNKLEQMQKLLKEMFQFEESDLDFGIYRIMNIKREEVSKFIDKELVEYVKEEIKTVEDSGELKNKLDELKKQLEGIFGKDIDEIVKSYPDVEKVKEYLNLKKEMNKAQNEKDIEEDIYNHIINFFSRYYDSGDFISKRRYSKDPKYAIPYNGEEVYLYWANHDQYYIKTSEQFTNYAFKVGDLEVKFEIEKDEVEVEQNNVKSTKDRFFVVKRAEYNMNKKELVVKFAYRALTEEEEKTIKEKTGKKTIKDPRVVNSELNLEKIRKETNYSIVFPELNKKHIRADGTESDKSELEWHLNKYTTKNTSDYFIHKDLGKFLKQELDFYIKNEMFYVDEILDDWDEYDINLKKIKVFKKICLKIIDFLAQIENFQKKLWEKKKFVVSTDYCITLDYIDEKYYPEILSNEKQLEEWKKLFDFDVKEKAKELKKSLMGYSGENPEIKVLKQHPTLTIDTKFFDEEFKYKILSEIDNLDEKINGILINSENFQALNLLLDKYEEKVKCIYIDPPYNAKSSEILYKNSFKHSSWLSLMDNRVEKGKLFLKKEDGVFIIAIDENEQERLGLLLDKYFIDNKKVCISVVHNPRGIQGKNISFVHEYAYFIYPSDERKIINDITREEVDSRNLRDSGTESDRTDAKNCFYPFIVDINRNKIINIGEIPSDDFHPKNGNIQINKNLIEIWPIDERGNEKKWRFSRKSVEEIFDKLEVKMGRNNYQIYFNKNYTTLKSLWNESKYDASEYGTKVLQAILGKEVTKYFSYPKSIFTVKDSIEVTTDKNDLILDFFAGSGTTGHAVLKLNKEDGGNRKFILVEMGHHFDTVLKPRIQKVIYSQNWKEGKPQDNDGSNKQIIKYQRLEQYEDTLNNIEFEKPNPIAQNTKDYKIKYMLEFESRNSKVFLNLDGLEDPFNYTLKIQQKDGVIKDEKIDLVETFNYIAGIEVSNIIMKTHNSRKYVVVRGKRNGDSVIVIWRNTKDDFDPVEDKKFIEEEILKGEEFSEILTNGNSLVKGAKSLDEIFKTSMFRG